MPVKLHGRMLPEALISTAGNSLSHAFIVSPALISSVEMACPANSVPAMRSKA